VGALIQYFVYVTASYRGVLYTGVNSDLETRLSEHRLKMKGGFTARYNIRNLVYYEAPENVQSAIAVEKGIGLGPT
jgi:putative endonuclease